MRCFSGGRENSGDIEVDEVTLFSTGGSIFYMHVALTRMCVILAGMTDMTFLPSERLPEALTDAMVEEMRPLVRAQLLRRMNDLFELADDELESGKDRVRWAELQIRIADRVAKWCRLDVVATEADEAVDPDADRERVRRMVAASLDELAG